MTMEALVQELPDHKKPFLEKHKRAIVFVILFLVVLGLFVLNKIIPEPASVDHLTPTPTRFVQKTVLDEQPATRKPLSQPYLVNVIKKSKINVIDYSWYGDYLVYSTSEGIYDARSEDPIIERGISYINFNDNGMAVLKVAGNWSVFNFKTRNLTNIKIDGNLAEISNDGIFVASFSNRDLFVLDINKGENKSVNVDSEISSISWSKNKNIIAVFTRFGHFYVYDTMLNLQKELLITDKTEFLDISPDGDLIAMSYGNKLTITDLINKEVVLESNFTNNSVIKGNWIDSDTFVAIETNSNDPVGRINNIIWKINMTGTKVFLIDSKPITRKINTYIKLKVNESKNIIPLAENDSKLWILSLIPGRLPVYSAQGISFHKVQSQLEAE